MDCSSEEQLIRMKLDGIGNIKAMYFDIPNRRLEVIHVDSYDVIFSALNQLNLDTKYIETITTEEPIADDSTNQKKLLWNVLFINFFFFILEIVTGVISNSMGLIADSLDMLADSIVYSLALFAVGGTLLRKRNIAKSSGYFQLVLAVLGFIEVIRRFLGFGEMPSFQFMVIVSILALIGNAMCLYLLQKSKSKEAHMQASMIFTSNDVIVNLGVIIAGILVYITESKYPDLIIGTLVFVLVARGAFRILKLN